MKVTAEGRRLAQMFVHHPFVSSLEGTEFTERKKGVEVSFQILSKRTEMKLQTVCLAGGKVARKVYPVDCGTLGPQKVERDVPVARL